MPGDAKHRRLQGSRDRKVAAKQFPICADAVRSANMQDKKSRENANDTMSVVGSRSNHLAAINNHEADSDAEECLLRV